MGQALRLEVILLSKEKAAAPRPKPRGRPRGRSCGRPRGRCRGRPRGRPRGGPRAQGGKPSKTFQTLNPLQNPPNTFPNRHPRAKATAMAFYWLSKLPFASPQTLQTLQTLQNLQTPSKTSKHHPKPPNPPGLEACFEQVAQGLWLVRRVHRRSKTISLPRARTPGLEVNSLTL